MSETGKVILDEMSDGMERSGAQIAAALNMSSGKLYPTLMSLEQSGDLSSRWADEGYPRRRLYKLVTAVGQSTITEKNDEH